MLMGTRKLGGMIADYRGNNQHARSLGGGVRGCAQGQRVVATSWFAACVRTAEPQKVADKGVVAESEPYQCVCCQKWAMCVMGG